MSIQLGGVKWSNTAVKGVGSELGIDKVIAENREYPKEGFWDARGTTFRTYHHGLDLDTSQEFPYLIDGHEDVSCTDFKTDLNLMSYKLYRRSNPPEHARHYDPKVAKLYGFTNVEEALKEVCDFC